MTFFTIENIKATLGGRWLQRPASDGPLVGVGLDTREDLTGRLYFAIQGERFDGHDFLKQAAKAGASMAIVEKEIPAASLPPGLGAIQVESSRKALGRLGLAYRRTFRGKVIAVVGSAGKTTTKRLIDAVLATSMPGSASPKSFNNDIGVPVTLLGAKPSDKYVVVEVGTNHLGEISHLASIVEPDIVVITMIGREHLEGLGSLESIASENAAILDYLRPGGLAVVNADAPLLRKPAKRAPNLILFGEAADADLRLTRRGVSESGNGWWFEVNDRARFHLSQPGRHNAINALAAVALGRRLNVSDEKISQGLGAAEGAPMRMACQPIGGVTVWNDAYNANPESMLAALDTFTEIAADASRRVLILGDMLELGPESPQLHREIARRIVKLDQEKALDLVVLVGELAAHAAGELEHAWGPDKRMMHVAKLDESSGGMIADRLELGDAVLIKASRGIGLERLLPMIAQRQRPHQAVETGKPGGVARPATASAAR